MTGTANLEAEREGLQRERLQQLVRAEKRRAQPDSTEPVTADRIPCAAQGRLPPRQTSQTAQPGGHCQRPDGARMEALLLANQPATEAMAARLAAQRGHAIQSVSGRAKKLPAERLFLAAPKLAARCPKVHPGRVEPGDTMSNTP